MGSVSISSCICCMFVSSVHPAAVLNAAFLNAGRGCKRRPNGRGILQSHSHDCLVGSHECLLLLTPSCYDECFFLFVEDCVHVLRCCECVYCESKIRPITFG